MQKQKTLDQTVVFVLLVVVAVVGRWMQPDWNFTPMAAVALFAGFFFANRFVAMLVPALALSISNLFLPAYSGVEVMISVYASLMLAAILGTLLKRNKSIAKITFAALLPSILFFVVTNFSIWAFHSWYPHTMAGLILCFESALIFFRSMLCGDLLYSGLIFGIYALCENPGWSFRRLDAHTHQFAGQ